MSNVTELLNAIDQGDAKAAEELLPLIYDELRKLAAVRMASQPPGQTLQATALVHEAYLKLVGSGKEQWESRRHFFAAAAEAMRHILIDRARRRLRMMQGDNSGRVDLDAIEIAAPAKAEIALKLNDALEELRAVYPERAEIVKLRFFAGFNEAEIAGILNTSERSIQRQWAYAKAWLFERIETMESR